MSLEWIPPWIEIAFSGAVALGFGLYQIWSVNREIAKDKAKKAEQEAGDSPVCARHPER